MAESAIAFDTEQEFSDIPSKLLKYISVHPGIRYRELLRLAGLTNGVLTYHISSLKKSGQITVDRVIRRDIILMIFQLNNQRL
jgi:predicted transcriptional regulator